MKTKLITLFLAILSLFNSYCLGTREMKFVSSEKMNLDTGKKIVKYISEKDTANLISLFSEETLTSNAFLQEKIKKLFEYCSGTISDSEKWAMGMDSKIEKGETIEIEYHTTFRFIIKDVPYLLYYIYIAKDSSNSKRDGVRTLRVVKEADDDKYFFYWQRLEPGIFVPEE